MHGTGEPNTEALAGRAAAGDPQAFAELFGRTRQRLEMWIALRTGPVLRARLTTEDVLQETFLQAFRSRESFVDQGPGSFRRWLIAIAENRFKDLHKHHAAQKRHPAREVNVAPANDEERELWDSISAGMTSPSSGAQRDELVGRIVERLELLPDHMREVVVLRILEERPFAEVAETMGRSTAAVKALYARALKRLKDEFDAGR